LRNARELQDVRVLHKIRGLVNLVASFRQGTHTLLVAAQSQPLEQERVDLTLQLTRGFVRRPIPRRRERCVALRG